MSDANQEPLTIEDATMPGPESTDPDYLAWRDARVRSAIAEADANPDDVLTQDEMWKKFRLDR